MQVGIIKRQDCFVVFLVIILEIKLNPVAIATKPSDIALKCYFEYIYHELFFATLIILVPSSIDGIFLLWRQTNTRHHDAHSAYETSNGMAFCSLADCITL